MLPNREIQTIARGYIRGGLTSYGSFAYDRMAWYKEVFAMERSSRTNGKRKIESILFNEEDRKGVQYPHNEALAVMMLIANCTTRRILIDDGSSANLF